MSDTEESTQPIAPVEPSSPEVTTEAAPNLDATQAGDESPPPTEEPATVGDAGNTTAEPGNAEEPAESVGDAGQATEITGHDAVDANEEDAGMLEALPTEEQELVAEEQPAPGGQGGGVAAAAPEVESADLPPNESEPAETDAQLPAQAPPFFADPSEGTITIRFTVRPEGFYFQQSFPTKSPCLIMYKRLETQLSLARRTVQLYWDGRPLADADVAADICALPESDDVPLFLDLEIEQIPEHFQILSPGDHVIKVIKTQVNYGADIPPKLFFVTMVKGYDRKPFIGGWKHKTKTTVYHNATSQCSAEAPPTADLSGKLCRTTQTMGVTRSCQTRRECGTQMPKPDLLVDDTYDRVRVARPYFSADRLIVLQTQKTVVLQAFVRGWRARKIARKMRSERDAEEQALSAEDARRRDEHGRRRQDEVQRRTHPTTAQDFNVLHNELEAWRLQEVERINAAEISEEERRIAMMELLKKQTKLLQTIDRLQIQASKENRFRKINTVLNQMSSAKVWGNQTTVHVETPFTVRARELRDLYDGLQLTGIGIDERLDVLLHVKWTVKEFECPLTREIVELVDREADLLNRGRKENSLSGLRQRLSNLFLQFIETPEFNPEAAQFQRVPLEFTARPLVKLDKK